MKREVAKNEFLNQLNWLFMGLSGSQVLTITNLENAQEKHFFAWTAFVNDKDKTEQIINAIKSVNQVEISLETHLEHGLLRRKCSYQNGFVQNLTLDQEIQENTTDIDLIMNWSEM